ncbi:protein mono-ADP-ribosyltransferase PARP3-like [Oratosquilla oratoria]|uniref:protein mono-ADP-ribosyltransferase PARP3-like n=1 Tax=Oratosquilla oratoria TaxID=337810 RepID=UPI003F758A95
MPRGRKRAAKAPAPVVKEEPKEEEEEPPAKLQKELSENSKLRKAIETVKQEGTTKKTVSPDQLLAALYNKVEVHEDFACMLNQTNIGHNNNKFYIIQVAKADKNYVCFTKWGRVGEPGQHAVQDGPTVDKAIGAFKKKFKDKTKNDWDKRDNFEAKPGKYTLIEIDEDVEYNDDVDGQVKIETKEGPVKPSKLDPRTQKAIKIMFSEDMFTGQMASMNLDIKKMPLGKLSKSQIAKGLECLLDIEEAIKNKKGRQALQDLSSRFFTLVPHDFGRRVPTTIDTLEIVQQKKELMMTLSDIELTLSIQKVKKETEEIENPLDEKYNQLGCSLEFVPKTTEDFKVASKFVQATQETWNKAKLLDLWKVNRNGEASRFDQHDDIEERKLLWHGTNVAVVAAILNSGLRIMPHSGGRVGKGLYFASEFSKSAGYVGWHYGNFDGEKNIGFMFLVEVALGKTHEIKRDNSSLKCAPKGFDSVVARGNTEPDTKANITMELDSKKVVVPVGKAVDQKEFKDSYFSQSEYLIYKESQARIRYLLKLSFH